MAGAYSWLTGWLAGYPANTSPRRDKRADFVKPEREFISAGRVQFAPTHSPYRSVSSFSRRPICIRSSLFPIISITSQRAGHCRGRFTAIAQRVAKSDGIRMLIEVSIHCLRWPKESKGRIELKFITFGQVMSESESRSAFLSRPVLFCADHKYGEAICLAKAPGG